jgi:ribonuclease HI
VGAVVTSAEDGTVLAERGEYIGEATNNVAEYRAVLLGLSLARDVGGRSVEVVNDSELVARQIGGQYKVKNKGLQPLFLETMKELREFESWSVRNVPRAMNVRADELVNQALDREA